MAFRETDAEAAWNEGAEAWDDFIESGADYYRHEVHGPALLAACEPLGGRRVLDIGCGQGYFTRLLAKRGASVVGIDVAAELLALATAREEREPLGIAYHRLSASNVAAALPSASFDTVTGCMSLHDVADVQAALSGAFAVLRPRGRLVFSVPHPATEMAFREWERDELGRKRFLKVDRYFDTGATEIRWNMPRLRYQWSTPSWRYTLSEWARLVAEVGFVICQLYEPRPTAEQLARKPDLDDCSRVPFFLVFDLSKPTPDEPRSPG
jgi:SAM-dependent methyltransferase